VDEIAPRILRHYPVGDVAQLSGVSVRTLHHYDELGLLTPSERTAANHRRYSEEDLQRLRQILFYRELGFGLAEVAQILANPGTHVEDHLRRQHRLLRQRQLRTQALLGAVEHEMQAREMGIALTPKEQLALFGTARFAEQLAEAGRQWGIEKQQEVGRRTTTHTADDWVLIKAEADANIRAFAAAIRAGEAPTSTIAMDAAEQHRAHLSRWFSSCSHAQHREVAAMYLADQDAIADWEKIAPGFSHYVHDAILSNAERARNDAH